MATGTKHLRTVLFKIALVAGFLLALVVLIEAVVTYRYVTKHLVLDHLTREGGRYVTLLESRARRTEPGGPEDLRTLLQELRQENGRQIAWIRVFDRSGDVLVESGDSDPRRPDPEALQAILDLQVRNMVDSRSTPRGEALVALLPFRFQFSDERPSGTTSSTMERAPRFKLAEVALYLSGAGEAFMPLRRNLVVSFAAALVLVVAMAVLALKLPGYFRGRELEQQLEVAQQVQQGLLPADIDSERLEVASQFVPYWGVGGDYFDVFAIGDHDFLVLGDVSGKGLPAALIMGLLHGAVRSSSSAWDGTNHGELAVEMNELLCARTAKNRFVTLFWACYVSHQQKLHFINAGHNPTLRVRPRAGGSAEVERLVTGGPVLGLLPGVPYDHGSTDLGAGDLLVLFSDGVVEATNSADVQFGQERLEQTVRDSGHLPPAELKRKIMQQVSSFLGKESLDDDLTLLVVRVPTEENDSSG